MVNGRWVIILIIAALTMSQTAAPEYKRYLITAISVQLNYIMSNHKNSHLTVLYIIR